MVVAVAAHDWSTPLGKVQFARVVLSPAAASANDSGYTVALAGLQGSHALGSLAGANALAVIPAEVTSVRSGDQVRCRLLDPIPAAP
jgi:molybdopterin molybdotransferase